MSLDTLLKAAQYIEQQEQKKESQLLLTPSSLGDCFQRSHQQQQQQQQQQQLHHQQSQHQQQLQHFYDNVNNSRNNNSCHRHQVLSSSSSSSSPTSSPPTAYVLSNGQMIHNSSSNNNNSSSQLNHNDFDYGVEAVTSAVAATAVNGRSSEGRSMTEEPYSNGHLSPSSFIMIQTPLSSTTTSTTTNKLLQQSQLQQGLQQQQQQQQQQLSNSPKSETLSSLFSNNNNNTTITIVDSNKNAIFSNGNVGVAAVPATTANGSNGSINLAALSAAAAAASSQPIVINVTNNRTATNTFSANLIPHSVNTSNTFSTSAIRTSPPIGIVAAASTAASVHRKNCIPLTPPPIPTRKFVESSRIRSCSLSSNKITASGLLANNGIVSGTNGSMSAFPRNLPMHQLLAEAAAATAAAVAAAGSEDSSQSSLNLSSSAGGYLNGAGGSIGSLNLSASSGGGGTLNGISMMNGSPPRGSASLLVAGGHLDHPMAGVASSAPTSSGVHQLHGAIIGGTRRRTISSNSNGSSCTSRAGTREVHNKLEKHRRAQLKECFEQLKNQLQLKDEERKKTSNLAILGAALKQIKDLQRQEQELEQQSEQLAKEKINAQKKIVSLKRELGSKIDNIDFSSISTDIELGSIPIERVTEGLNDSISLSSGRGSMLYSSSSSLSSGSGGNTMSSPLGAGMQTPMPTALSPVISQSTLSSSSSTNSSNNSSPISPNMMIIKSSSSSTIVAASSSSPSTITGGGLGTVTVSAAGTVTATATSSSPSGPLTVNMPLSLTAKNISATSLTRGSPTPSTPSPSPSSSSGVSSSSSIHSSSPPMGGGVKVVPNIPANGVKFGAANVSANGNTFVSSPVINITSHSENNGGISSSNSNGYYATAAGMPLNMNSTVAANTISTSSSSSTSSIPSTSSPFFSSLSILSATAASASASATSTSSTSSTPMAPTIATISHSKELNSSGRNGLTRKVPSSDSHPNKSNDASHFNHTHHHHHHLHHHQQQLQQQQQQHKLLDEGEQPAKVFKVFNGIALGSVDKGNKLGLAGAPLQLSQVVGGGSLVVSPFLSSSQNGANNLRLVGGNSLATIELSSRPSSNPSSSSSSSLSSSRSSGHPSPSTSSPPNNGGAQLHKLLMSAVGASASGGGAANNTPSNSNGGTSSYVSAAELGRLPGGAELNILPTATNGTAPLYRGNGKLAIVNSGISLKGAGKDSDASNNSARGIQSAGRTSIAVSQVQQGGNYAQLIAASPQLAGKVNLSVGGQNLPLLSSQYLGSMKPMVVAVPNNSNQPTLPSPSSSVVVSSTSTASTAIVTGTTNGNAL